jgi:hypothetical protein
MLEETILVYLQPILQRVTPLGMVRAVKRVNCRPDSSICVELASDVTPLFCHVAADLNIRWQASSVSQSRDGYPSTSNSSWAMFRGEALRQMLSFFKK